MRIEHTFVDARRLLYMICSACKTVDDSFGSIQDLFAKYSRKRLQASPPHVCRCSLALASAGAWGSAAQDLHRSAHPPSTAQ